MQKLLLTALLGIFMSTSFAQNVKTKIRIIESGNDTIVKVNDGDTLIRVRQEFDVDTVVVILNRFNVSVGPNGLSITRKDSTKNKKIVTRFLLMDIGFAGFLENGSFDLSPENEFLDTRGGKSRNINLQLFTQRVRFAENHMNFSYGIMLEFNKYRLSNDVRLIPGEAPLSFEQLETKLRKNKLKASYLYIPLMFGVETKPKNMLKSFRLRAGMYAGINIGSKQKMIGKITEREKERDDFNLTKFRYGFRGEIGYSLINLYVHYAFSPMFKDGQGPELQPLNFGIMLLPF